MFDFTLFEPVDFYILPDDKGNKFYSLIESAEESIDIVIYEIYSSDVLKVLSKAKKRGVDICVIIRSQYFDNDFSRPAIVRVFNFIRALKNAEGEGSVVFQWSSNNFFLTHQKTVLIDARSCIKETTRALIATHNLANYSIDKHPDLPFWQEIQPQSRGGYNMTIRDAGYIFDHPELIKDIYNVFNADKSCSPSTNNLKENNTLVWSNGSFLKEEEQYPPHGIYVANGQLLIDKNQGNAERAMVEAIISAKKSVWCSAESLGYSSVTEALASAAKKGIDVRLFLPLSSIKESNIKTLNELVSACAKIKYAKPADNALYFHIKQIIVDSFSETAFAISGSTNFSVASIYWNRELSIFLKGSVVDALATTYKSDWALPYMIEYQPNNPPELIEHLRDLTMLESKGVSTPSIPCGPIKLPEA